MSPPDSGPAIPLSALLAPQNTHTRPHSLLPSPSAAILGPLPPTTPLHLVLNYIALSDLPEYEYANTGMNGRGTDKGKGKARLREGNEGSPEGGKATAAGERRADVELANVAPTRALIITGSKDALFHALQDEDEDWMRNHGSDYGVMAKLKRCDIRYCSTPQQLTLLLALLTSHTPPEGDDGVYNLYPPPGLVVLYDIAALFMHWEGGDENAQIRGGRGIGGDMDVDEGMPGEGRSGVEPHLVFNDNVTMSTYLDIISAARATTDHLSQTSPNHAQTQLVISEPSISDTSTLPIMPRPDTATSTTGAEGADAERLSLPSQSRSKRITILDGLSWMLGRGNVGVVSAATTGSYDESQISATAQHFKLEFPDADDHGPHTLRRRRCGRGEWASRAKWDAGEEVEGDLGGWRWEWGGFDDY